MRAININNQRITDSMISLESWVEKYLPLKL